MTDCQLDGQRFVLPAALVLMATAAVRAVGGEALAPLLAAVAVSEIVPEDSLDGLCVAIAQGHISVQRGSMAAASLTATAATVQSLARTEPRRPGSPVAATWLPSSPASTVPAPTVCQVCADSASPAEVTTTVETLSLLAADALLSWAAEGTLLAAARLVAGSAGQGSLAREASRGQASAWLCQGPDVLSYGAGHGIAGYSMRPFSCQPSPHLYAVDWEPVPWTELDRYGVGFGLQKGWIEGECLSQRECRPCN